MKAVYKNFYHLSRADQCMQEVLEMLEFLNRPEVLADSALYQAGCSGVVVTYCRPFMSGEGMAPLNGRYSRFADSPDPKFFEQVHGRLFDLRNQVIAHHDLLAHRKAYKAGKLKLDPEEMILRVLPNGFHTRMTHSSFGKHQLSGLTAIATFQKLRLMEEMGGIITRMKQDGIIADGIYQLNGAKVTRLS